MTDAERAELWEYRARALADALSTFVEVTSQGDRVDGESEFFAKAVRLVNAPWTRDSP